MKRHFLNMGNQLMQLITLAHMAPVGGVQIIVENVDACITP